jgi:hypothetical protein
LSNSSRAVALWELNGTSIIGGGVIANPGAGWRVASVGDFNDDGRSDILWQNSSGAVVIWEMNGASVIGGASLGIAAQAGTRWGRAISTETSTPTSCGRTTAARSPFGK